MSYLEKYKLWTEKGYFINAVTEYGYCHEHLKDLLSKNPFDKNSYIWLVILARKLHHKNFLNTMEIISINNHKYLPIYSFFSMVNNSQNFLKRLFYLCSLEQQNFVENCGFPDIKILISILFLKDNDLLRKWENINDYVSLIDMDFLVYCYFILNSCKLSDWFLNNSENFYTHLINSYNPDMIRYYIDIPIVKTLLIEAMDKLDDDNIRKKFLKHPILKSHLSYLLPLNYDIIIKDHGDKNFVTLINKLARIDNDITLAYYLGLPIFDREITKSEVQTRFSLFQLLDLDTYIETYMVLPKVDYNNQETLTCYDVTSLNINDVVVFEYDNIVRVFSRDEWRIVYDKKTDPYTNKNIDMLYINILEKQLRILNIIENYLPKQVLPIKDLYNKLLSL